MASKEISPQVGLPSYSCPHCGALAHQAWFSIFGRQISGTNKPSISRTGNVGTGIASISYSISGNNISNATVTHAISNLNLSQCFSCKNFAVWLADRLIHPVQKSVIEPHEDMPADVRDDFLEAASIVDLSPRGAAALLRLGLQKLMADLGETGTNINADIKSLVSKGLETEIQRALDVVRVVGNNAVHPGEIDLKDDKATAITLLSLINIIVERRIAAKNRIDELFNNLPAGALEAIAKRDEPK
jgi:hypothetical protein